MKSFLVAMLLLFPLPVLAETYQWTDEKGTVNFAEDLGKVPKKYRKQARPLGDEGGGVPRITETAPEPAKDRTKREEGQKAKQLIGGKDEAAWRKEFNAANYALKQSESDLAELKARLADTSKMSRTEYLSIQNSIKHVETRIEQQQKRADELRESADRAGVPADWRK